MAIFIVDAPAKPPLDHLLTKTLMMISTHSLNTLALSSDEIEILNTLEMSGVCLDSRAIKHNEVFVLLDGANSKGRAVQFVQAVADCASVILTEVDMTQYSDEQKAHLPNALPMIHLPNLRQYLGDFVYACLQDKQRVDLPIVVAVTGTNGKTTISQLVAQLVHLSGNRSAVMGTVGNGKWGQLQQSTHTTSDVLAVHGFAHQMGAEGVDVLALEASSHGLDQHRLQGLPIQSAIFSNLSRDHLDYHADMMQYAKAKARLFNRAYFKQLSHAIINIDDEFGAKLAQKLQVQTQQAQQANVHDLTVWTYGTKTQAHFYAKDIRPSLDGTAIDLVTPFGEVSLQSPLLGLFNVENLLASVAGFLSIYPTRFASLPSLIATLQGVRGRMEKVTVHGSDKCVIVDYAHTPDALTHVLTSLKVHCNGQLWVVFGCGGDRDKGKRPLMTQAALDVADRVILTSDNPRSESPAAIIMDMQLGLSGTDRDRIHIEPDRKQAIGYALANMGSHDVVVVAGKGHETYQEINGVRHDFDDAAVVTEALVTETLQRDKPTAGKTTDDQTD